jgi:hypothetical protein
VTRKSCAISLIVSPRVNRSAASGRNRCRRCCSADVYPPRCAYRMYWSYARNQSTSRPEFYEFILVEVVLRYCKAARLLKDPLGAKAEPVSLRCDADSESGRERCHRARES